MKEPTAKAKQSKLPEAVRKILLYLTILVMIDILTAFLGGPYLSTYIGTFFGHSNTTILSDIMFLEGSIIFALGIFVAVAKLSPTLKSLSKRRKDTKDSSTQTPKKGMSLSTMMIVIGIILIGLAVIVAPPLLA